MEMGDQFHTPAPLALGTHWIRGLVGPRASLDILGEEKNQLGSHRVNTVYCSMRLSTVQMWMWPQMELWQRADPRTVALGC